MPHADSLALPEGLDKRQFYEHVCTTLEALLTPASPDDPAANFITCLSNAASLLYGSYENYEQAFGRQDGQRVNWAGFYLVPSLLSPATSSASAEPTQLLLGPFHGRPACLSVSLKATAKRPVGVCAAGFLSGETVVVPDVEARPGHIACDGVTRSEVVVPIVVKRRRADGPEEEVKVGVLDIDCEGLNAFDEKVDREGLERFVKTLVRLVRWDL
ncbi:L-methionine (R)-S-oxide reductase [Rhodotorula paludigena]|uniref:L-methionine (R)-S-oxide reductase n=1 Tax=Rhodotorula paludigena TaxID=86838 RepID=UPI00317D04A5